MTNSAGCIDTDRRITESDSGLAVFIPIAAALLYPWVLKGFHAAVIGDGLVGTSARLFEAAVWLAIAFLLPLSCLAFAFARGPFTLFASAGPKSRRIALVAVTAPPLFVLVGVSSSLLHSPVPELVTWVAGWLLFGLAVSCSRPAVHSGGAITTGKLRVIHGVAAALIALFVAFHLLNHLLGLMGPDAHARVMHAGRLVYRSDLVQPVLVGLLLFQVATGLVLARRWVRTDVCPARMIQVGSGIYLAAFILTHLNSALISARLVHGIDTDWGWATSAPEGLIMSAWSIRLVPHYALGVFFVLTHLMCGLRGILLAHGYSSVRADRIWQGGMLVAAIASVSIMCGLCGLRL